MRMHNGVLMISYGFHLGMYKGKPIDFILVSHDFIWCSHMNECLCANQWISRGCLMMSYRVHI